MGTPVTSYTDVLVVSTGINPQNFDNLFANRSLPLEQLLPVLGGIVVLIIAIIIAVSQFKKWKKFREFEDEMKGLDLAPDQEGTLASMVKRFTMEEPVQILFSARLFDEMATTEIVRVLGSPGSAKAKQQFIDKVYQIRTKTYYPEWGEESEDGEEKLVGSPTGAEEDSGEVMFSDTDEVPAFPGRE